MTSTVHRLVRPKPGRRVRVPLRVGDVWVLIGPRTEVVIRDLTPRPTAQKPDAHAVTLDDGRTLAESTLRYAYQRKAEHDESMRELALLLRAEFPEWFPDHRPARVIHFPAGGRRGQR